MVFQLHPISDGCMKRVPSSVVGLFIFYRDMNVLMRRKILDLMFLRFLLSSSMPLMPRLVVLPGTCLDTSQPLIAGHTVLGSMGREAVLNDVLIF